MQRKYISRTGLCRFLKSQIDKVVGENYYDDCLQQPAMQAVHHDLKFRIQVGINDSFEKNKTVSLKLYTSLFDDGLKPVRCLLLTKKFFIVVMQHTVYDDDEDFESEDLYEYTSSILQTDGQLFQRSFEESQLSDRYFISKIHRELLKIQNIRKCECGQFFSSPDSFECFSCMLTVTSDVSDAEQAENCAICLNEMRTELYTQPCCKSVMHKACFKKAMRYDLKCPVCRC